MWTFTLFKTASDMKNSINKFSALLFLLLGGANCTNNTPKQQENVIITPAPHLKKRSGGTIR